MPVIGIIASQSATPPAPPTGDKTLEYNFAQNWGSSIGVAVIQGPTPTFGRGSDATGVNDSGNIATATGNNPRFHHSPQDSSPVGLLVEETGATNLCEYSENLDFNTTSWSSITTRTRRSARGHWTTSTTRA